MITKNNCQSSADRAKQIKTKAIVNEDPTEKLIRFIDLIPENIHRYHDEWWCFNTVFNDELVMVHLIHDFQSYWSNSGSWRLKTSVWRPGWGREMWARRSWRTWPERRWRWVFDNIIELWHCKRKHSLKNYPINFVQSMSKKELEDMKKQWMEEMKANMKNNEKVKISAHCSCILVF